MALIPIEQDADVAALQRPDGLDFSSLTEIDRARLARWSAAHQAATEGAPASAWRAACVEGVSVCENLSDGAAIGFRKYVLYETGRNAWLFNDAYGSDDACAFVQWTLSRIEHNGWGPDGNSSALGTMHSACMGTGFGAMINPATGRYEAAAPTRALAITLADRRTTFALPDVTDQLLSELAEVGRREYFGENDDPLAQRHALEGPLGRAPMDVADDFIAELADRAIPAGSWTLYGAAEVAMWARTAPEGLPAYVRLQCASLRSRRDRGVWDFNVSVHEMSLWRTLCASVGGEDWQPVRTPPTEAQSRLTPMAVGEERRISTMSSSADSNLIIVTRRAEDEYVSIVDQAQSRGEPENGRVRNETASASSLYELYRKIGPEIPAPQHEIDAEFEPFLRHARPDLPGVLRPVPVGGTVVPDGEPRTDGAARHAAATGSGPVSDSPAAPAAPAAPATPAAPAGPADWYPDPRSRFEYRYFDGTQWTEHVATAGRQSVDPV